MEIALYLISGIVIYSISYILLRKTLNQEALLRNNYRNNSISSIGGIIIVIAFVIFSLITNILNSFRSIDEINLIELLLILGFAFLGLIDDLIGDKSSQGFKGHIKALLKGNITTGALKLFGGPIICAIALSSNIKSQGYFEFIIDIITISLIANLFNLLDLSPGRTSKYALIWIGFLFAFNMNNFSNIGYFIFALILSSMILDLREHFMLGDIGSNAIGALIGYLTITNIGPQNTLLLLAGVLILNVVSEIISFSTIISKVLPLRIFDSIGQLKERKAWLNKDRT